ncbi:hypothetical protein B0H14DRAFT_2354164 [Mycena olivaceomarginata]|nr:hypothetical protein B0H14DRAFT_2354164 [Mycena olivaceomarginata]
MPQQPRSSRSRLVVLPERVEAPRDPLEVRFRPGSTLSDSKPPERGWADANPLVRSTKEMGLGFRRDTLDDHFNDWNHKKIIALGEWSVDGARHECSLTALADMNESLRADEVKIWGIMVEKWEADIEAPNPFETIWKDQHVASVRAELAAEAAAREAAGAEEADTVRGDMHVTELIAMGLQLEEQQYIFFAWSSATGLHPMDGQRRMMIECTSKLQRKIFAWIDIQQKFFLALANICAREHEARACATNGQPIPGITASNIELCLPSAMAAAPAADKVEVGMKTSAFLHEYRLRIGQASEVLHDVCRQLLVRTHLYQLKDDYSRGVWANMRSGDRIAALNHQIKRVAGGYRVARKALVALGQELGRNEWERTLLPLAEEDVRGLPRATFHDLDRKKKKKKQKRRKTSRKESLKMSWIWVAQGESWKPEDDTVMNEAVRIEWAKTRARANRWAEEVDLLEEEMCHVDVFLQWRSGWWKERVGLRGLPNGPQCEGETAYAIRQSAVQATLAAEFATEWDGLKELIRHGRVGELLDEGEEGEQSDEEREGAGNDSGEEEPILLLPARTVNPIYVDEVLTM